MESLRKDAGFDSTAGGMDGGDGSIVESKPRSEKKDDVHEEDVSDGKQMG